ncbi:MAG TPA: hypothetical protein VN256_11090 [Pyrinomonadaceae bacterium]|nr:hypothetical protein [Pyrinomonadaceae bacterium]
MSLLSNITPDQVVAEPFPHVVVENALDEGLCQQLLREFPRLETFTRGRPTRSNQKIIYTGAAALADPHLSERWKSFIREHLQPSVWAEMLRLFRTHLLGAYPDFEQRFGKPDELRVGTRNIDDYSRCDLLLDSELVVHAPVVGRPAVERGPHLKTRDKPFAGYLYLRPDEDDAQGSDHVLYSVKPGASLLFDQVQAADPELLIAEKVIPYRNNTFIFFLNTPESIQGLTARSASEVPLMMHHFVAQMREPLFDIDFKPVASAPSFVRTWARRSGLRAVVRGARRLGQRLKTES